MLMNTLFFALQSTTRTATTRSSHLSRKRSAGIPFPFTSGLVGGTVVTAAKGLEAELRVSQRNGRRVDVKIKVEGGKGNISYINRTDHVMRRLPCVTPRCATPHTI
jgi:hypothetical protein